MFSSNLFGFPIANFQNKIYNYYIIKSYVNLSFSLSLPPSTHKYIYILRYIYTYIYSYVYTHSHLMELIGVHSLGGIMTHGLPIFLSLHL